MRPYACASVNWLLTVIGLFAKHGRDAHDFLKTGSSLSEFSAYPRKFPFERTEVRCPEHEPVHDRTVSHESDCINHRSLALCDGRRNMKTGQANGRQPRLVLTAVRRSSCLNV